MQKANLLSFSWSSGGSMRPLNSTLTWISIPRSRAIFSSINCSWRIPAESDTGSTWALTQLANFSRSPCTCLHLLTDMVYGAGTEFPVELFRTKAPQVLNGERPQVEDIVARESISLLQEDHLGSQKAQFYCRAKTTWSCSDDQTLWKHTQKYTRAAWASEIWRLSLHTGNI